MENLFYRIAEWLYFAGIEVLILLISAGILYAQLVRNRNRIASVYQDSPTALMLVDIRSGDIVLSNRPAMQLLGIRQVGKKYRYPSGPTKDSLLQTLSKIKSERFQFTEPRWSASELTQLSIEFYGRRINYNNRAAWLIYAVRHQESGTDSEQVKNSLTISRAALDSLSELVYIKNNSGSIVDTNRAFDVFWEGRYDEADVDVEGTLRGRQTQRRWTTDPQGRGRLLETTQSILMTSEGEVIGSLGISHDVTDWFTMQQNLRNEMEKRKGTEIALAQRDTILQSLMESSPDAIALFNENGIYEACNKAFALSIGVDDHVQLVGKRIEDVLPRDLYEEFIKTDQKVMEEGVALRYRDKTLDENGQPKWFDVVKSPYRDTASGFSGVLLMARDVTDSCLVEMQLEEMNQELERLSFMDGLTQIANRRRFDEQLEIIWNLHRRQNRPVTVMLCDIDHFKDYNDNYGHQQGDETLRQVAQSFLKVLTRSSDCVARYGGEEFGFIIPETDHHGAQIIARKVHNAIRDLNIRHEYSTVSERVTISIGVVSLRPGAEDSSEKLIEMADQALYVAKNKGRNQTRYHQE